MNVVQNEYPYTDNNNNRSLINSIVILQQKKHPLQSDYLISPLTLEQITLSTAKRGISDIIMSVWEYMKLVDTSIQNQREDNDASSSSSLYSRPTEGLYENAALSFASTGKHDELAFGILAEMEGQGHEPSRSFLSRLASTMRIRSSVRRLDRSVFIIRSNHEHAMNNYHHGQEGENDDEITMKPTKSTLNTLIAAYADLGFSTKAMEIYDDFERLECTPDENTYSYLMDSIVMNVTTTLPFNLRGKIVGQKVNNNNADMNDNASTNANGNQYDDDQFDAESWLDAQIEAADAIYEAANEMGHGCDGNLIHAYVQILCSIGKLEKAKSLLDEKVDNREWVPEETFGLLALSNAHIGNMEAVDDVVQMCRQTGYKGGLPIHVAKRIQVLRKSM
jgi:pentatricopeptide repeat protein